MNNQLQHNYTPDYVSPPGETLLELLEERGMTQADLADRTGRPKKTINEIINGKAAITPETALQLERVLGTPAKFWLNREQTYRDYLARQAEQQQLSTQVDWLQQVPVKDMIKLGWINACSDKVEQMRDVLNFFGVSSPDRWQAVWGNIENIAFRQANNAQPSSGAVAAWLCQGEIQAQSIHCQPYDAKKFRDTLQTIRSLTVLPQEIFQAELVRLCADVGVAVVIVPALPKTKVSGATRWLTPHKALMILSLRYKSNDQFWFTVFHEAGHILLHPKRETFIDESLEEGATLQGSEQERDCESEANQFAADWLIPPAQLQDFRQQVPKPGKVAIKRFAQDIGIHPGIVAGRLQREGTIAFSFGNDLKQNLAAS